MTSTPKIIPKARNLRTLWLSSGPKFNAALSSTISTQLIAKMRSAARRLCVSLTDQRADVQPHRTKHNAVNVNGWYGVVTSRVPCRNLRNKIIVAAAIPGAPIKRGATAAVIGVTMASPQSTPPSEGAQLGYLTRMAKCLVTEHLAKPETLAPATDGVGDSCFLLDALAKDDGQRLPQKNNLVLGHLLITNPPPKTGDLFLASLQLVRRIPFLVVQIGAWEYT